jgi:hypothetical protein
MKPVGGYGRADEIKSHKQTGRVDAISGAVSWKAPIIRDDVARLVRTATAPCARRKRISWLAAAPSQQGGWGDSSARRNVLQPRRKPRECHGRDSGRHPSPPSPGMRAYQVGRASATRLDRACIWRCAHALTAVVPAGAPAWTAAWCRSSARDRHRRHHITAAQCHTAGRATRCSRSPEAAGGQHGTRVLVNGRAAEIDMTTAARPRTARMSMRAVALEA